MKIDIVRLEVRDYKAKLEEAYKGDRWEVLKSVYNIKKEKDLWSAWKELEKDAKTKTRVYIFLDNESILDDLVNRWHRDVKLFRKYVLPEVFKAIGKEVKATWSQYAGCRCGCSPGFILDDVGKCVFVDVALVLEPNEREEDFLGR